MTDASSYYARRTRERRVEDEEWAARRPYRAQFTVHDDVGAWGAEIVRDTAVADLPLLRRTVRAWSEAVGPMRVTSPYIGHVAASIADAAVRDRILVPPEPGTVGIGFAWRDEAEREMALGWCFKPAACRYLVIAAHAATPIDELGGGEDYLGAQAVAELIARAAGALGDARQGVAEMMRSPTSATVRPTPWTHEPPA